MLWNRLPQGGEQILSGIALVSLAFGLMWTVDAATEVEVYDELTRVDPWGERGAFTYAPLLADGTARPMGEPGYFTTDAPRMRVAFAWTLDDAAARRVTALGELALRVEHASWTHVEPLGEGQLDANPGNPLAIEGVVDLPAVEERIEATPGRDASAGRWSLVATVRFESTPVSAHRSDGSEFVLPIQYTPPLYSLPGEEGSIVTKDHAREQVTRHEDAGGVAALVARPAGPLVLLAGLAGLVAFPPFRTEVDA